jgi:hypothetical protein
MYRYSLTSFLRIFVNTLEEDRNGIDSEKLISYLAVLLLENTLENVCYGLSNELKLTIVLFIIHGARAKKFGKNEWEMFMEEFIDGSGGSVRPPSWLPDHLATSFQKLGSGVPELVQKS